VTSAAEEYSVAGGWHARLGLGFRADGERTILAERSRLGPLGVQRPFYPEADVCHVYLLHPPGGVVGGDSLTLDIHAGNDARVLITTPGATKFYRSAGVRARVAQRIVVEPGGALEWLPQENIFFPGADVELETRVELHGDARLVLWEIQCFGRPVIREGFDDGRIDTRLAVCRDGRPLVLERLRVCRDIRARLALMAGYAVSASMLVSHAGEVEVATCRDLLGEDSDERSGVTLVDDILVVRHLGSSTERARSLLRGIWERVREATLGRRACPPRIWAT